MLKTTSEISSTKLLLPVNGFIKSLKIKKSQLDVSFSKSPSKTINPKAKQDLKAIKIFGVLSSRLWTPWEFK